MNFVSVGWPLLSVLLYLQCIMHSKPATSVTVHCTVTVHSRTIAARRLL